MAPQVLVVEAGAEVKVATVVAGELLVEQVPKGETVPAGVQVVMVWMGIQLK